MPPFFYWLIIAGMFIAANAAIISKVLALILGSTVLSTTLLFLLLKRATRG